MRYECGRQRVTAGVSGELILLSVVLATLGLSVAAISGSASAADWTDSSVGYRYGTQFAEPGATSPDHKVKKSIFNYSSASGFKYGSNFFSADFLMSDSSDPPQGGGGGAQEVYAVWRGQLSFGKMTGASTKFGFVRDVSLLYGFDLNAKDDAFAPRVRKLRVGPSLNFDVPGFWDLVLIVQKETNHNGIVGTNVSFKTAPGLASTWMIPVPSMRARFAGYFDYIGAKGKDGFGADTKPETHFNGYFLFDVGSMALDKKDTVLMGVGYEYWRNKFGNDEATVPGAKANTPMLVVEVHY